MNSLTLKEKGFAEFIPIKDVSFSVIPLDKPVVIALADTTLVGQPTSDLLFIGKSKKPAKRIFAGYFAGHGGKVTRKINNKLFKDGYLEKVTVSWMLHEDPKTTQRELLETFKTEHGQYPEWNLTAKEIEESKLSAKKAKKVKPIVKKSRTAKSTVT